MWCEVINHGLWAGSLWRLSTTTLKNLPQGSKFSLVIRILPCLFYHNSLLFLPKRRAEFCLGSWGKVLTKATLAALCRAHVYSHKCRKRRKTCLWLIPVREELWQNLVSKCQISSWPDPCMAQWRPHPPPPLLTTEDFLAESLAHNFTK